MADMMGFDFEEPEAVRQEAAKPPLQPSPSKQPARKPAKVVGHCFCGETQEPKNGYCARHKRAYECIWRQYVGKNGKITEEAEIFYTIFGDVKRARQFPGKPDLAEEALMDFVEEFPEAANGSRAKRGETNLSKYFHQTGTRVSKDDVSTHMKMDWELFSGKMKLLRGWEKEESRRHWRLLEDDPTVAEDMKGVKDSAGRPTKRLAIPPTYFGGDSTESRSSQYEDKSMIKESKPMTNLDDDTFAAYLAECRKGFKDTSQQDVAAMMQETFSKLGRSSLTGGTGLKDAIAMMMNSLAAEQGNDAQQQPQQQPQTQPEGGSNPQPQQQQQHEQQQGGPAGSDDPAGSLEGGRKRKADLSGGRIPKKVDISRKRTEATNSWKREFDTLKNKVISVVDAAKEARSSANAALDGDFLGLMADRQLMAELWLGNAGGTKKDAEKGEEKEDAKKGQEKDAKEGEELDAKKGEEKDAESQEKGAESQEQDAQSKEKDTESKEKGAESQGAGSRTNHAEKEQSGGGDGSGSSQAAFTKFITSLKLLPVESPDQILVLSAIMDRVDDLRSCEDEAAILLIAAELGAMKELINQMCVAVRAVVKSLVSNRQRRERQAEKDEKKNAEKRTADGARLQRAAESGKRARELMTKNDSMFKLDWNSVGCPEIESVTVSDFVDGTDLKYNYDRPLILTENEEIGGLEVDSAPAKSLQRWASTFAGSATASTSFRCAAPVSTVHGVKDVMEAFSPLLPATRAGLPGFVEKDCHSAWWFGYTSKHARFDMEPLGLGSLRYIYEGSMSVLLVEASSLKDYIHKGKPGATVSLQNMEDAVAMLSADSAQSMKSAGVLWHHGVVKANEFVIIPVGWFVGTCTINNSNVSGIRMPHVAGPAEPAARNLNALREAVASAELNASLKVIADALK